MKTITINAYEVNELSPKAFGNAHQEWLQQFDWYDYDCYLDDIKRLLIIFDLGILDYSLNVDWLNKMNFICNNPCVCAIVEA
jgi:hypothetical protein